MENKDAKDPSQREKFLYELSADATCEFENGESLRINKAMLAFQSPFFMNEFFGPSPKSSVKITNFDRETFKTFLNCLFGIKEYTILDALLIYPIAHQYEVKASLEKCTSVLEPKEMSENVCCILNLASFYARGDLVANVINFIKTQFGIINLLESRKYRCFLEPLAVSNILEHIEIHSFVWEIIYEWGRDYLIAHNKSVDITSFFKENGVLSKIQLSQFESVQSIFNFVKITDGAILDSNDVLRYLESKLLSNEVFPNKSEWIKLDSQIFTETLEFVHAIGFNKIRTIFFFANQIVTDDCFQNNNDMTVSVRYRGRLITSGVDRDVLSKVLKDSRNGVLVDEIRRSKIAKLVTPPFFWSYGRKGVVNITTFRAEKIFNLPPEKYLEIKSFEITYDFTGIPNCRILKTPLSDIFTDAGKLFFTKNVLISI